MRPARGGALPVINTAGDGMRGWRDLRGTGAVVSLAGKRRSLRESHS